MALLAGTPAAADSLNVRTVGTWNYGPCRAAAGAWIGGQRYAVISSGRRLQVLDIGRPDQPQLCGDLSLADDIFRVWVAADRAYVAYERAGLAIVDLAQPSRPALLATFGTNGRVGGVALSGQYLAAAAAGAGLLLVDVADPARPALAGQCALPGPALDVAVDGTHAYVSCGVAGLQAVEISDPANPFESGHCDLTGTVTGVELKGRHAFIAGSAGLAIVNIDSLAMANRCPINHPVSQVQLSGDFALLQDNACGIRIVDIQDLTDIGQGGYGQLPFSACQVTVMDSVALVADSLDGLRILDLSGLHHWSAVNAWAGSDTVHAIAVTPDSLYAYLAAGSDGLRVFKISDPMHPSEVGSYRPGGRVYRAANYSADILCVAAGDSGVALVDIADPTAPRECARLRGYAPAYDVGMSFYTNGSDTGRVAAVARGDSSVWVVRITDSLTLEPMGPVRRDHPVVNVTAYRQNDIPRFAFCCSGGNTVYDFCGIGPSDTALQFRTWGIARTGGWVRRNACRLQGITPIGDTLAFFVPPSQYTPASRTSNTLLPDSVEGACIGDTTFCVSDGPQGLQQFLFGDIGCGHCATPGQCRDVAVAGSTALVADGSAGLEAVDLSRPNGMAELGSQRMALSACALAAVRRRAYLAGADTSIWTIDLADSSRPAARSVTRLPSMAFGLAARDSLLLVADGDSGLQVCGIADPDLPALLGAARAPGFAMAVAAQRTLAGVAADSAGLELFDIGDPAHPTLLGRYDSPGTAFGLALDSANRRAVLADGEAGVEVVDIADPAHPALLGGFNSAGCAYDIALNENHAYVADGQYGLLVLDIGAPASPVQVGGLITGGTARQLTLRDSIVFLADGEGGLAVINIADPSHPAEVGNYAPGRQVWAVALDNGCVLALDDAMALRLLWPYWTARQPSVAPQAAVLRFENRPNPFNASTAIDYQLSAAGDVAIAIYNIQGQLVRTLVSGRQDAGGHRVAWDGRDGRGQRAAAGVYLCHLAAAGRQQNHKLVLVR
ncbi:MAG TPA: FlgD immunoglobulin-like domain containing protein [Candidatus Edwardsbacteria bacterium]|nr:FlgD immunoglobulin-like domain containing protein [Candidatus Edwardsbacteria bacterium]